MKICIITSEIKTSTENRLIFNLAKEIRRLGHIVCINQCDSTFDFILCNSIANLNKSLIITNKFKNIKSIAYNWDLYYWMSNQYDFHEYGLFLNNCIEIWTPSQSVIERTEQFYKLVDRCHTIKSYVEFFENEYSVTNNFNFVYHPLRDYKDPQNGWIERACNELKINYLRSNHKLDYESYKKSILNAKLLVCEYFEASTGGLSLLEGYFHGKNILVCDSEFMGAKDYFGERANYFKTGSYKDFKEKVQYLFNLPETSKDEINERQIFCSQYSIENMALKIIERLKILMEVPDVNKANIHMNFFKKLFSY